MCSCEKCAAVRSVLFSSRGEKAQDSFVSTFIFCSSIINLFRVAYAVQCFCSDFTDMLGHIISSVQFVTLLKQNVRRGCRLA